MNRGLQPSPTLIALFAAAVIVAFVLPFVWLSGYGRLVAWFVVAAGVIAFVLGTSGGTLKALLIDERNRYSQPAFIALSWFVVIVSSYLSCAVWNVALWTPGSGQLPLAIDVPPSIWVLAGIVGVDVIAEGTILGVKKRRVRLPHHTVAAAQRGMLAAVANTLSANPSPTDARLTDMVTYDELGLEESIDPAALQKLLFQVTAVIVYAIALGRLIFLTPAAQQILGFPSIPEGFLALLGVSTATAVVNRSVPR